MSTTTLDLRQIKADRAALVIALEGAGAVFRGNDCTCPFHDDKNRSAGVYEENGVQRFHCFPCEIDEDVIGVRARIHGRSVADELREMRAGINGHHNGNGHAARNGKPKISPPSDWGAVADRLRQKMTADQLEALASATGLPSWAWEMVLPGWADDADLRTMRAGGAGWADDRPSGAWAIAEHGADGAIVGLSLRTDDGRKGFPSGAHRGIVIPTSLNDMAGPVIGVEGGSDVVASVALGIAAIGRPSNRSGAAEVAELVKDRDILIVGENDQKPDGSWPGRDGAIAVAQKVADIWGRPVRWTMPPAPAKDIRDWFCTQAGAELDWETLKGYGAELMDALQQAAVEVMPNITAAPNLDQTNDLEAKQPIVPISIDDLIEQNPTLHPPIVEGLFREGETVNIISASKIGKTHFVIGLGFAVATGRVWLNRFQTHKRRVLLIDYELHAPTLADRINKIRAAMGIMRDEVAGQIDVLCLRGKSLDIFDIAKLLRQTEPGRWGMVVIDAMYRTFPKGTDENSNADVMHIYNLIDACAAHLRAAVVLIHHASKGNQSGKEVVDVGSGAGSQSRAADDHIILRPHEQADAVVMDARLRSFKSPDPICLKFAYPLWVDAPELDPTQLRRDPSKGGRPRKSESTPENEPEEIPWTPERFVAEFVTSKPTPKDVLTSRANRAGIAFRTIAGLIAEAESAALMFRHSTGTTCGIAFATTKPDLFTELNKETHTPPVPPSTRVRLKAATRGK